MKFCVKVLFYTCLSVHKGDLCMMSLPVWLPGPMFLLRVSVSEGICAGDLCSEGLWLVEVSVQGVSVWGSLSRGSLDGGGGFSVQGDLPQN